MMMATSTSTDDNNFYPCKNGHQQTIDFLAIQQEIHHTMISMQSFFPALLMPDDNIVHMSAWMTVPMTMTNMAYHFIIMIIMQ